VMLRGLGTLFTNSASDVAALPVAAPDAKNDFYAISFFFITFFLLNWGCRLILMRPIVRWLLPASRKQQTKFLQSFMELTTYAGFAILGSAVVTRQDFVWPSFRWWDGFSSGGHELMRSDIRCYYIMYIARYSEAFFTLMLDARKKDFVQMLLHHSLTVMLACISYFFGWNRVGVVLMLLFDFADVPLHLAKLCKYMDITEDGCVCWQFLANRFFEIFAIVFFFTRLVMYGYVCWSAHVEASWYFPKGLPEWTCVVLLYSLYFLQLFWFYLIVQVAIKLCRGMDTSDVRSDDEEETPKKND